MSLLTGLLAYYSLDTDFSDVFSTYDLVNTNSTIVTGGIVEDCANLSGSNQYFRSPAPVGANGAISVWFKYTSFVDSMVIGLTQIGVSDFLRIRPYSNTNVQFTCKDENINVTVAALGTDWHHAVITWSSSEPWKCYLDGALVGTGSAIRNPSCAFTIPFGVLSNGAGIWSSPFYFNGKLDEIGIWDRFLTATDVTALYNGGACLPYPFITVFFGISGVVTLNGSPVGGATIRCIRQSDNVAISELTTDSSGEYLFDNLDESELYHLAVEYESGGTKYNAKSLWDISPIEVE